MTCRGVRTLQPSFLLLPSPSASAGKGAHCGKSPEQIPYHLFVFVLLPFAHSSRREKNRACLIALRGVNRG
ncbi:hypothetical protein B0H63DRAFT_305037 [Podospora didyma]|uniref:Uncharacterized protein n=1 Tax=Podospora didyma TaxID=330526 RepID=A0AAE0K5G7_9PEZI|nr:hypothetical protein B0H63DRAFT_305037 [Podospora didyma]